MKSGRLFGCPVELAVSLIGGKWKTIILARLKQGPRRYGELRRDIPELADKVLSQRLRELQADGFVSKTTAAKSKSARYSLTPRGKSLSPALEALYAWGETAGRESGVRFRTAGAQRRPQAAN